MVLLDMLKNTGVQGSSLSNYHITEYFSPCLRQCFEESNTWLACIHMQKLGVELNKWGYLTFVNSLGIGEQQHNYGL